MAQTRSQFELKVCESGRETTPTLLTALSFWEFELQSLREVHCTK
jgi:hypothetical protein